MSDGQFTGGRRTAIKNLVIAFVIVVVVSSIIAGGVGVWISLVTFDTIVDRANSIESRIKEQQEKIKDQQNKIKDQIKLTQTKLDEIRDLTEKARLSQKNFQEKRVKFYIRQQHQKFLRLFDSVRLDELHLNKTILPTLGRIEKELTDTDKFPVALVAADERDLIRHMTRLLGAARQYGDGQFDAVTKAFPDYDGNDVNIHRLLRASYRHLYDKGNDEKYLRKARYHAKRYDRLVQTPDTRSLVAKLRRAGVVLRANTEEELDQVEQLLTLAIKLFPDDPVARYNYAAFQVIRNNPGKAMRLLAQAKELGGLRSEEDIRYFCKDRDFQTLMEAESESVKMDLKILLGGEVGKVCGPARWR
ncbi:MAG: hypothetical protein ACE5FR_11475 [Rhodospirillales bacterium]